jgi:hypothetical protein
MAKAHSPIRIQDDLMRAARAAGQQMHRSTAEQIEYWASIGKSLSGVVDADQLLDVISGLATIEIKPVGNVNVDFDTVLDELEKDRSSGVLEHAVRSQDETHYQACRLRPGFIERVEPGGAVIVGKFENGVFKPE